jgi:hypothetical protein
MTVFPNINTAVLNPRAKLPSQQHLVRNTVSKDVSLEFANSFNPSEMEREEVCLQENRPKSSVIVGNEVCTEALEQKVKAIPQHRHRLLSKPYKSKTAEMGRREKREQWGNRIIKNID